MAVKPRCEQLKPREIDHQVVAAVLSNKGRIGLFRRSNKVSGDVGLWHCITGFLSNADSPLTQALVEIEEEVGICGDKLQLCSSAWFDLLGNDGITWRVHAFHFLCQTEALTLNWENDAASWVFANQLHLYPTVTWLDNVFTALAPADGYFGHPPPVAETDYRRDPIF